MEDQNTVKAPQSEPTKPAPSPAAAPTTPPPSGGPGGGRPGGGRFGGGNRPGGGRFGGGNRFGGRPRRNGPDRRSGDGDDLVEKVVFINRSSKVVKGGRRFSFSALIVVGDKKGKVGVGLGKATEVAEAIRKGGQTARAQMVTVHLKDTTIPHEVFIRFCGAKVLLRPASPGTGVIAGKTVRAVLEAAGVRNVLSKSLGSNNSANVVKATLKALVSLREREEIFRNRGIELKPVDKPTTAEVGTPSNDNATS